MRRAQEKGRVIVDLKTKLAAEALLEPEELARIKAHYSDREQVYAIDLSRAFFGTLRPDMAMYICRAVGTGANHDYLRYEVRSRVKVAGSRLRTGYHEAWQYYTAGEFNVQNVGGGWSGECKVLGTAWTDLGCTRGDATEASSQLAERIS